MSQTIETSIVQQFGDTVLMLAEQRGSRLRPTVAQKSVTGEAWTVERLGSVDYQEITGRFQPMPLNELEHTRRWGYIRGFDAVAMLDSFDKVKKLVDFESPYTMRLASTIGRALDRTIITALDGSVQEGKTGATTTPFPAGQTIFNFSTGTTPGPLNLATLIRAKERLLASEAIDDPASQVTVAFNANGWRSLLEDDRITNADYNTLRALEDGNYAGLMGMRFVRTELLPDLADAGYNSNTPGNRVFMYRGDAIEFGVAKEPGASIDRRVDLRTIPWQAYIWGAWGAVRTEDVRVVRILATKIA